MLDQALLGSLLEHLVDLQLTESLDVDGTTLLVCLVIVVRVNSLNTFILAEFEVL